MKVVLSCTIHGFTRITPVLLYVQSKDYMYKSCFHFTRINVSISTVQVFLQAPGGHNLIGGVFDYIKKINRQSQLIGFLNGPQGIYNHNFKELNSDTIEAYRNMGGFDMICSGRHKIESQDQKAKSLAICRKLDLHGLIIVGGDDSNTNAAVLAEYFATNGCDTVVVGCPKTIDGDLKNEFIEISFGFDTATKVYSESIGNVCADVATSQEHYHFIRLMGRSASNIALECALQTRPNLTLIGEEIQAKHRSFKSLRDEICDLVIERAALGKKYGVILLPEGLIEFIPEIGTLVREINDILDPDTPAHAFDDQRLTEDSRVVFQHLPPVIREELLIERDAHGNVQTAKISTERLLILAVQDELTARKFNGVFLPRDHYFGYEGRCAMPSNFDANYCTSLGHTAAALVHNNANGYMAVIRNLHEPVEDWMPAGFPISMMMHLERRKGKDVPVIKKYLVDLEGPLFTLFSRVRNDWKLHDLYRNPGPIQFHGSTADIVNYTINFPTLNQLLPEDLGDATTSRCFFPSHLDRLSPLQRERLHHRVLLNPVLRNPKIYATPAKRCLFADAMQERSVRKAFRLQAEHHSMRAYAVEASAGTGGGHTKRTDSYRIGVALLGQPVPGVMNVVHGLFERAQIIGGSVIGFKGGVRGLLKNDSIHLTRDDVCTYVNSSGFEMLGRSPQYRDAIRTDESLAAIGRTCTELELSGLVLIGGKYSLTDACLLAEYFLAQNIDTRVIGVPASMENNVREASLLECPIGFDSTAKATAALVGNLVTDARSAGKYWYFIRVMGNTGSHIVLETALLTRATLSVIAEQYAADNAGLHDVVRDIADVVQKRAEKGMNYGACLVPEGLLMSLPQLRDLILELTTMIAAEDPRTLKDLHKAIIDAAPALLEQKRGGQSTTGAQDDQTDDSSSNRPRLSPWNLALLQELPSFFREQICKPTATGRFEVSNT